MKKVSRFCLDVFLPIVLFSSCKTTQQLSDTKIVLKNNSSIALTQKPVSIARNHFKGMDLQYNFPILVFKNDTIPAQVNDLNADGKWDEVFFTADFLPNEEKTVELRWSQIDPKFTRKTSVRFGKREAENIPVHPAQEEVLMADQVYKKLGYQKYQTDGPHGKMTKLDLDIIWTEEILKMCSEKNFLR
nr:DUF4861 family protein [Flavobacterium foetidum]